MRRLVLLAAARRDLVAIDEYVIRTSGSVKTARRFTERLRERCVRLAALPGTLGVARPDIGRDMRSIAHQDYLIVFRYTPGSVRVLRVVEGHRDIASQFQPGEPRD